MMNIFKPRAGISILPMRKSVASAKCIDFITSPSYLHPPTLPPPLPPQKKTKQNKTKRKAKREEVTKTYFQSNLNL